MPYVPNLESSSQIMEDTTLISEQQPQERIEIDATPASAVKQRRDRRKKKRSQAYTVNTGPYNKACMIIRQYML